MNNKILMGIIAVLAAALLLQTGYLVGKGRLEQKEEKVRIAEPRDTEPRPPVTQQAPYRRVPQPARAGAGIRVDVWDPFEEMNRLQRVMNRMFNDSYGRASRTDSDMFGAFGATFDPAIDVKEQDNAYIVIVDLPGVNKDTINISAQPHSVTISGERSIEKEERDDAQGFFRAERSFGSFQRTIPLMEEIVPDKVTAETAEGVLLIKLPKTEKTQEKAKSVKITVN